MERPKFIRKNGKVIPIRTKTGPVSNLSHKRKGARYDKSSGDYLTKSQRKASKKAEAYSEAYVGEVRKKLRPKQELWASIVGGTGIVTAGGGLKSGLMRGLAGAAIGYVGAGVYYSKDARKAAKRKMKNWEKLAHEK